MKAWLKTLKSLIFKAPPTVADIAPAPSLRKFGIRAFENIMAQLGSDESEPMRYSRPKLPDGVWPDVPPTGANLVLAMDSNANEEPAARMAYDDGGTNGPSFSFLNSSPLGCGLTFPGFPFLASLQQISEYRAPCEVLAAEMTREWVEIVSKGNASASDEDGKEKGKDKAKDAAKPKGKMGTDAAPPSGAKPKPGEQPKPGVAGEMPEPSDAEPEVDPQQEKIDAITERMEELKLRERFYMAALHDLQFGGGFLYWEFKGQDGDKARQTPLTIKNIAKDSLLRVSSIEPYWMTPYSYNSTQPNLPDFYVPQSWYMIGKKTHVTRLSAVIGRPLPDLLKPSYNFVGISLAQLMAPYIDRWLRTAKSVNDLISIFSIVNLSTNMEAMLAEGNNGPTVLQRAKMFTAARDNKGIMITDKDSEELQVMNAALSGLDKLQAQAQEHMAAPSHIPLIKLFGITPTGLNATSEGEFQAFYDWVGSQQQHVFGDHMNRALEIVQMDLFGEVDDDITFKWKSLFKPTAKEQAEMLKSEADRDTAYVTMGAISPDEVRQRIAGDPNSGYEGLAGAAPGPMDQEDGTDNGEADALGLEHETASQGAEHEHEAGENDKNRQHESKENDKDRKHALQLERAKPRPKVSGDASPELDAFVWEPVTLNPDDYEDDEDQGPSVLGLDYSFAEDWKHNFKEAQHPRDKIGRFGSKAAPVESVTPSTKPTTPPGSETLVTEPGPTNPHNGSMKTKLSGSPAEHDNVRRLADESVTAKTRKGYPFRVIVEGMPHTPMKFNRATGKGELTGEAEFVRQTAQQFKTREDAEKFVAKLERSNKKNDPYTQKRFPVELQDNTADLPDAIAARAEAAKLAAGHNPKAIGEAIAHLREPSIQAAGEYARDLTERYKAILAKNDWSVEKAFPVPRLTFSNQAEHERAKGNRTFAMMITKPADETKDAYGRYNNTDIRQSDPEAEEREVESFKTQAKAQFTAYEHKLNMKIGEVGSAEADASSLWNSSLLYITKPDGTKERWHTQQILNTSVLGKLFNQWPTRKKK